MSEWQGKIDWKKVKAAGYSVEEAVIEEDTEETSEDLLQFGVEAVE